MCVGARDGAGSGQGGTYRQCLYCLSWSGRTKEGDNRGKRRWTIGVEALCENSVDQHHGRAPNARYLCLGREVRGKRAEDK